jgi:two-component sensor histidine kinase
VRTRNGGRIPVHFSIAELRDDHGELDGYVCVASNISRRQEAEDRLVASLREKELLLKEVHHRVKNNLQVISSLLNLQANSLQDPEVIRLFHESQGRVRSMALIHEQLYQSDDLVQIDFAAYVRDLVQHLQQGLGNGSNRTEFHLQIEPLPLSLELAIPCGMIVNELVSNAQKHAFPEGCVGEIRIEFACHSGVYCLSVADNGVGLSRQRVVEPDGPSLGLSVVEALTRQLHGELEVCQEAGTRFVIRFQLEEDRSAP